jgi:D-serine deaminase-like pyridoxal phosphate-dependent protein
VVALLVRCRLSIIVDHLRIAEEWSAALMRAGRDLDVLVKVDVGLHRCGISPELPFAATFVERVARLPRLRLRGLLSHAGHGYAANSEVELAAIATAERDLLIGLAGEARRRGVEIEEISVGATPTARFSAALDGITELRPGNYVFYDRTQVGLGVASLDDCALTVLARVVSKPAADRLVLDCGSKTLSNDGARGFTSAPGHGLVLPDGHRNEPMADLLVDRLSEEHAVVVASAGRTALEPGDLVRVLPNHACVVTNLVDELVLTEGDEVVEMLPVAARGRIR